MKTFYLITLGTSLDDLPLQTYETEAGVQAFLDDLLEIPDDVLNHGNVQAALKVSGRDLSPESIICVGVWKFVDGFPVDHRVVDIFPEGDEPNEPGRPIGLCIYDPPVTASNQEEWDSQQ